MIPGGARNEVCGPVHPLNTTSNRPLIVTLTVAALTLAACETGRRGLGEPKDGPGAASSALYFANTDHDTLARVDPATGAVRAIGVGDEPSHIARVGGRLYVTLRGERAVGVFDEVDGTLRERAKITVGTEPVGVVANDKRVYVAASTSNEVVEIDADSLTITRRFEIPGEPRWLALHPNGEHLYAGSAFGGHLAHVALGSGQVQLHQLPEVPNFGPLRNNQDETGEVHPMTRRITGDIAIDASGTKLVVPALFVDNVSTIRDNEDNNGSGGTGSGSTGSNTTGSDESDGARAPNGDQFFPGGGGGGYGEKFNPGVVVADIDTAGVPDTEGGAAVSVTAFGARQVINGYPASVALDTDGKAAYVSIEGAGVVVAIALPDGQFGTTGRGLAGAPEPSFGGGGPGLQFAPNTVLEVGAGVSKVIVDDAGLFAHAFFDHKAVKLDHLTARSNIGVAGEEPANGANRRAPTDNAIAPLSTITLAASNLPATVDRGRRMFFATTDAKMAGNGAGVSCATCHFDGRADGLTWSFERGDRQTPSLAGDISAHEPVGWQGDRPTVAEDAMMTSQGLMGGNGLTVEDTLDIQSFVNWSRDVDHPGKGSATPEVMRGKAIFERGDTGCVACHSGERYTNNLIVPLYLDASKVRPLVGLAASAPYFHDGSAATLRDVLERAKDGSMGNTGELTTTEMDDLEAYLRSL